MKELQMDLFGNKKNNDPKYHWFGMPEFHQEKKEPYAKIILRVDTKEDLEKLSCLLDQKINKKTKSIWFPFKSHWGGIKKEYISES